MDTPIREPLYIKMHAGDNVAIVGNDGGLAAGAEFPCGLKLVERVPQGHKVALVDFAVKRIKDELLQIGRAHV